MTVYSDEQLKRWATCQRNQFKTGNIKPQRERKLNEIPNWQWEINNTADTKKNELLAMASRREKRPTATSHPLGNPLIWYTNPKSGSYDEVFDRQIRLASPSWFPDTVGENQAELIRLAKSGNPKPSKLSSLGQALRRYTNSNHTMYDEKFDLQIRSLSPSWFVDRTRSAKEQLLSLAAEGKSRPTCATTLGNALARYSKADKSTYDESFTNELRRLAPGWFVDSAAEKKVEILNLAKMGKRRPTGLLGQSLSNYIRKGGDTYDADFSQRIQEIAPQWFIDRTSENKRQILELARRKQPKPVYKKHPLGAVLASYLQPTHKCYDPAFEKELKTTAPQWFIKVGNQYRDELLQMARSGDQRPSGNKIASAFWRYIRETSNDYDQEFASHIRELRPDWLVDATENKKSELLNLAVSGAARPSKHKEGLGQALVSYTNQSCCYDAIFDAKIRKIAPHWFSDTAAQKKKELLDLARAGKPKPVGESNKLRKNLYGYITEGVKTFDRDFSIAIRKLRPDWFLDLVRTKKDELLKIAVNNQPRPGSGKHPLGERLCAYVSPNNPDFDSNFSKKIRELRPDWFIDTAEEKKNKLINIAINGEDKPKQGKKSLYGMLNHYTCSKSKCYDKEFDCKIRKLRPDWFL